MSSYPKFGFSTTAEEAASALSSHIKGKTILITGISKGGLGFETARVVALHQPKLLILAGRTPSSNDETAQLIKKDSPDVDIKTLQLDLASFAAIRKSAEEVNNWPASIVIDVLINNAGIMGGTYNKTVDGIEDKFAVNHLGPFLFTNLILSRVLAAGPGARIVNLSSRGHTRQDIRYDDYNWGNGATYNELLAYGASKTGNVLFSKSLAVKLAPKGVLSFSVHPGGIWTNLGRSSDPKVLQGLGFLDKDGNPVDSDAIRWKTIPQGASTTIVAAFDPRIEPRNGYYLQDCNIDDQAVKPYAVDDANAERLWKLSEELVGEKFDLGA